MRKLLPTGEFTYCEDVTNCNNMLNQIHKGDLRSLIRIQEEYESGKIAKLKVIELSAELGTSFLVGFLFVCDLKYPKELFKEHHDLPLCPRHYNKLLIAKFFEKQDVFIHYRELDCYLRYGIK